MTRSAAGRALAAVVEPIVGSVYFSPEAHPAFVHLGHGPCTGQMPPGGWDRAHWGDVLITDFLAYFCGRGRSWARCPAR